MKTSFNLFLVLFIGALFITSCKSLVTIEDVRKQESKALKASSEARKEALALADIKEQYSKDRIEAEIDKLEKEQKNAKRDIKKLKGIATESAVGTTAGTLNTLEKRSDEIDSEIESLKSKQPEDWEDARRKIRQDMDSLNQEIKKIVDESNK